MIRKFNEDISNLVIDYNRECISSTLDDVLSYVLEMLPLIGYNKKYIFDRFIRQKIAELFPEYYGDNYNNFVIEDKPDVVEFLKTLPQNEQRTEAWYNDRINSIGASESSAIFGLNPYESTNKLILKKCGVVNESDNRRMKLVCEHGIKYEQVIQEMYCREKDITILEFGSIRHQDPSLSIITASPDGITPNGCMLEIKAPAKRIITGIPPPYYWVQCQQQMQVCRLDKVDFLEVKIEEYTNFNDYNEDHSNDSNKPYTEDMLEKNVVIEYHKLNSNGGDDLGYIYPGKLLLTNEIKDWKNKMILELEKSTDKQFRRISYWKCSQYCLTPIYKDHGWWDNNVHKFQEFWTKVLEHRKNGFQHLLSKPVKRKSKTIECQIISDDDKKKENFCVNTDSCLIESDEN
jgi:putative phage-type endonuclease